MTPIVAISTVSDGSMYDPKDQENTAIITNRQAWLSQQGVALEDTTRLHISYNDGDFCRYRIVTSVDKSEGMQSAGRQFADALVTTAPGLALFLPVADCVATTLYDPVQGVLMLSHLGRHSLEQQGGTNSVAFLVENFGVKPENLMVWLAPAPNKEVYPIFKLNGQGMKEATFEQLLKAGVTIENITDNDADTATDNRYYSFSEFQKGNKAEQGRFAMMAVMQD